MDFSDGPFRKFLENLQTSTPSVYNDCDRFFYSCNLAADVIDTSKMSADVFILYTFNRKILFLTNKLWKRLLHLLNHQDILNEEHVCFSIIDTERCNTLNKYFLSFSFSITDFKNPSINSHDHEDYLRFLKNQYNSLESFLAQTLPYLALNIEYLTVKIQRSNNRVLNVTSFKSGNIGGEVNKAIQNYLKRLRWAIFKFKPENTTFEIKEKKQRIDNLIDGHYKDKSNFLGIPIIEIESEHNDDMTLNTFIDPNEPAALTISTIPTITKDLNASTMPSITTISSTTSGTPASIEISNNTNENTYATTEKSFKSNDSSLSIKKSDILNYVKNANIENAKTYYHYQPSALSSDNLNELRSSNENHTILIGSLFSLIGLFIFLIIFSIRRYKAKKEIQREISQEIHNEEFECVLDN